MKLTTALFLVFLIFFILCDFNVFAQRTKVLKRRRKIMPSIIESMKKENTSIATTRHNRNGRFLSLFTVVRFNNDLCPTSNGNNGTCYTASECESRGGTAEGPCAGGFGVCCYFGINSCGRTTSENATYFSNPSSPQRICNLMINRMNDEICQIRVDLDTFTLSPPDFKGQCNTDFFLVTGGSPVPTLCGANSGEHFIYSVTPDSGPSQISVVIDTTSTNAVSRAWNIRIHQYECTSPSLAPSGCLQYYTSASGQFKSFNYRTEPAADDGPNHLANLNYAICFRIENGFCGIKYSQVSSDLFSFTLSGDASTITALADAQVANSDSSCKSDYVVIAGGSQTGGEQERQFTKDRFCGTTLGYCGTTTTGASTCSNAAGPIVTYTRPFVFRVVTDANDGDPISTEKLNRGFHLLYSQLPCVNFGK